MRIPLPLVIVTIALATGLHGATPQPAETYRRLKAYLDSVPAIDTHNHLAPFQELPGWVETEQGRGFNLAAMWRSSYFGRVNRLTPWTPGGPFDAWWAKAKIDFADARATSFYRYMLPAFRDLYGIDFDRVTDEQARDVNARIFANYRDESWLYKVVTERANIELVFNDPHWDPLNFSTYYTFGVLVFRLDSLIFGFHPNEFTAATRPGLNASPFLAAERENLPLRTFDDYLQLVEHLFAKAKAAGAVCLKTGMAYRRSLRFEKVTKEAAAQAFNRPRSVLTAKQIQDFEDFMMWRITDCSARYELPFQIHTGEARIQGSNPILLVDLIAENPRTKFILFHGGFPWVGEAGAIVEKYPRNVWLDSVWLPTISYHMAKRAFHEWLDSMPADRIMWGADVNTAEGTYGAADTTRRCVAEVLSERVDRGDLTEEDAKRIGRQILRDNALKLFPQLQQRLWKHKGAKMTPPMPKS
jgi:hypothetical protein